VIKDLIKPKIHNFKSSKDYLVALAQENKIGTGGMTFNEFAEKLGWPLSYLPDLLSGRRDLTLRRAIELANKFELDSLETEKVVLMALADSEVGDVGDFFKERAENRFRRNQYQVDKTTKNYFYRLDLLAVFSVLKLAKQRLTGEELRSQLLILPELTAGDLASIIEEVIALGMIEFEPETGKMTSCRGLFVSDSVNERETTYVVHSEYLNLQKQFMDQRLNIPFHFNAGFLSLPRRHLDEISRRFMELRNWLISINQESLKRETHTQDCDVFQFNLNIFPMAADSQKLDSLAGRQNVDPGHSDSDEQKFL
jgi:uncharacterized protein (TIGR02147 family)